MGHVAWNKVDLIWFDRVQTWVITVALLYILQDELWGLTCNTPLKSAAIVIFKFHKIV